MQRTTFTAALSVLALLSVVACSPDSSPTAVPHDVSPAAIREHGVIPLGRYVAMGTSISMGAQSDGVIAATQETSWPAQFANLLRLPLTQPYFDGTGCRSPLRAPLASGVRLSGEGAGQNPATLSCSSLRADVELPVQNVAINAARTSDALFTTPENITDAGYVQLYRRVLAPGQTQVSTMMALEPDFVSVEFGGNEVLNSRSGVAIPGATMVPVDVWAPLYHQMLDKVESTAKRAILVGLIQDVATFPAFRRGSELWADRATFLAAFNVQVAADCTTSSNLLFVPVRVPVAVGTGLARRRAGASPYVLSCQGAPGTVQDFVLTPDEAAVVNQQLADMNAVIATQAEARRFAHFELEALYGRADLKPPFSSLAFMTSSTPYGPYISLDGLHPSALGAQVLAEAAVVAVEARYHLGIGSNVVAGR